MTYHLGRLSTAYLNANEDALPEHLQRAAIERQRLVEAQNYRNNSQNYTNQMMAADARERESPVLSSTTSNGEGVLNGLSWKNRPPEEQSYSTVNNDLPITSTTSNDLGTKKEEPAVSITKNAFTGSKRDQSGYARKPSFNEQLIRIGGAMMGGSREGGLAGLSAGTEEYGRLQDYGREQEQLGILAEERRRASAATVWNAGAEKRAEDEEKYYALQSGIDKFDLALAYLNKGNITGMFDGTIMAAWNVAMDNPKVRGQLLLKELRVDDALARVQKTKGAISNREMKLFLDPSPKVNWEGEGAWIVWVTERKLALQEIQNRMKTGKLLSPAESATNAQMDRWNQRTGVTPEELTLQYAP